VSNDGIIINSELGRTWKTEVKLRLERTVM